MRCSDLAHLGLRWLLERKTPQINCAASPGGTENHCIAAYSTVNTLKRRPISQQAPNQPMSRPDTASFSAPGKIAGPALGIASGSPHRSGLCTEHVRETAETPLRWFLA